MRAAVADFTPTIRLLDPPEPSDQLGESVLRSLSRPPIGAAWWPLPKAIVIGSLTLGLWPLLVLPRRFAKSAMLENEQAWHAQEWLRLQAISPAGLPPRSDFPPRRPLVPLLCRVARAIGIFVLILLIANPFGWRARGFAGLIDATWGLWRWRAIGGTSAATFYVAYTGALTVAYLCHWQAVRLHARRTRGLVNRFNDLLPRAGMRPIEYVALPPGHMLPWGVAAVVLAIAGALWAIPMMLATAAQSGYILHTRRAVREQLRDRVRQALASASPPPRITLPPTLLRSCRGERCAAQLPAIATFCPRCGTKAHEVVLAGAT